MALGEGEHSRHCGVIACTSHLEVAVTELHLRPGLKLLLSEVIKALSCHFSGSHCEESGARSQLAQLILLRRSCVKATIALDNCNGSMYCSSSTKRNATFISFMVFTTTQLSFSGTQQQTPATGARFGVEKLCLLTTHRPRTRIIPFQRSHSMHHTAMHRRGATLEGRTRCQQQQHLAVQWCPAHARALASPGWGAAAASVVVGVGSHSRLERARRRHIAIIMPFLAGVTRI